MKKFAFISRHQLTDSQVALAAAQCIEMVPVGDRDAFSVTPDEFVDAGFDGVVVVHPAMALKLIGSGLLVAVFENAARSVEGGPATFEAARLHVFDTVDASVRIEVELRKIVSEFSLKENEALCASGEWGSEFNAGWQKGRYMLAASLLEEFFVDA